jgi:hypothetical protein
VRLQQTVPTISNRGNITMFPKRVGLALRDEPTTTRSKPTDRVRDGVDNQRYGVHYISRYAPLALGDLCERGIP